MGETLYTYFVEIGYLLLVVVVLWVIKSKKQNVLSAIMNAVQLAENAIRESGMGEEKKAIVIAQLEIIGIKVTKSVSALIDQVVTTLNEKEAWLLSEAKVDTTEVANTIVDAVTDAIQKAITDDTRIPLS